MSTEPFPSEADEIQQDGQQPGGLRWPGGIPGGSRHTYTGTGDRFIYDADEKFWHPFVGVEDVVDSTDQVVDLLTEILPHLEMIRRTNVALANEIPDGETFSPTDDEL